MNNWTEDVVYNIGKEFKAILQEIPEDNIILEKDKKYTVRILRRIFFMPHCCMV